MMNLNENTFGNTWIDENGNGNEAPLQTPIPMDMLVES
jgi:hypothetical protein